MNAIEIIQEAGQRGVKFSCGQWDCFEDFMSYFERHYVPILEELSGKWKNDDSGAKRFFAEDMLEFFGFSERNEK